MLVFSSMVVRSIIWIWFCLVPAHNIHVMSIHRNKVGSHLSQLCKSQIGWCVSKYLTWLEHFQLIYHELISKSSQKKLWQLKTYKFQSGVSHNFKCFWISKKKWNMENCIRNTKHHSRSSANETWPIISVIISHRLQNFIISHRLQNY